MSRWEKAKGAPADLNRDMAESEGWSESGRTMRRTKRTRWTKASIVPPVSNLVPQISHHELLWVQKDV